MTRDEALATLRDAGMLEAAEALAGEPAAAGTDPSGGPAGVEEIIEAEAAAELERIEAKAAAELERIEAEAAAAVTVIEAEAAANVAVMEAAAELETGGALAAAMPLDSPGDVLEDAAEEIEALTDEPPADSHWYFRPIRSQK